jgi:hypothetical protein
MLTIEMEHDCTVLTSLDERGSFEDVEVIISDDSVVYISQLTADTSKAQVLELSFQQLRDILAGMELPEGAYYIKGQEAREI